MESSSAVSGSTKIVGVFGHPVTHTLSPAMHNAAFTALGLPFVYVPFPVAPQSLGVALRALPALGIVGVNLTIPHKEAALPFMDEVSEEAQRVGAVNTVHCVEGRLLGDNTDGRGFYQPLVEAGVEVRGRKVVVLGAGGAARAVVSRLVREGAGVILANRTRARAERLAEEVGGTAVQVIDWDGQRPDLSRSPIGDALNGACLLVNTTQVGMYIVDRTEDRTEDRTVDKTEDRTGNKKEGETGRSEVELDSIPFPIPLEAFHPHLMVYDLVYNPIETKLLQVARLRGCATLTGVKMLVYQGAAAFERWTGVWPPTDIMEHAVEAGLALRK